MMPAANPHQRQHKKTGIWFGVFCILHVLPPFAFSRFDINCPRLSRVYLNILEKNEPR